MAHFNSEFTKNNETFFSSIFKDKLDRICAIKIRDCLIAILAMLYFLAIFRRRFGRFLVVDLNDDRLKK